MISLYIHIPFCQKKCFYCSFPIVVGQEKQMDEYLDALKREAFSWRGTSLHTVYVGGGTPSMLNEKQIEKLFAMIRNNFVCENVKEWSFEINPESSGESKVKLLRELGVDRMSLGVQSLNEDSLKTLGRNHDRQCALDVFHLMRKEGFDNINVDFIFNLPQQSKRALMSDLKDVLSFGSDHVSLYSLSVEEHSRFFVRKIEQLSDDVKKEYYEEVVQYLEGRGFGQYEISNFAREGKQSIHNLNYWQGGNYVGLGLGAHSHFEGTRSWNVANYSNYMKRSRNGDSVREGAEKLNNQQKFLETFLLGLRMNQGVDVKGLEQQYGVTLHEDKRELIRQLVGEGFFEWDGPKLKTRLKGRSILDEICARMI